MLEVAERFMKAGRSTLAQWARLKEREERGHDLLALKDLRALGYDADALVQALRPPKTTALVRYFEQWIRSDEPVGCVGYVYALERLALEIDAAYIAHVEASLPSGVRATRCLRVHSGVGSDPQHVQEAVEFIAMLAPEERALIARACFESAALCFTPHEGEPLTEEVLQQLLLPFKTEERMHS